MPILGIYASANQFQYSTAFESIATVTGTGSSSSVTFSNIPQTYKHLQIRMFMRTAYASQQDTVYMYNFDGLGSLTNSAIHYMWGNGSSALANGSTGNSSSIAGFCPGNTATSNSYGAIIVDILDYANTNKNKTIRSLSGWDDNGASSLKQNIQLTSNLPVDLGTTAVSAVTILCNGNITSNSKFALYGIK